MEDKTAQQNQDTVESTPGGLLAAARQQQGVTLVKAAQTLNLSQHFIINMEQNDFDTLPGLVYLRGYVRNYARFLKLDEQHLINMLENYLNQHDIFTENDDAKSYISPVKMTRPTVPVHNKNHKKKPWLKLLAGSVILAAAAMVAALGISIWDTDSKSLNTSMQSRHLDFN